MSCDRWIGLVLLVACASGAPSGARDDAERADDSGTEAEDTAAPPDDGFDRVGLARWQGVSTYTALSYGEPCDFVGTEEGDLLDLEPMGLDSYDALESVEIFYHLDQRADVPCESSPLLPELRALAFDGERLILLAGGFHDGEFGVAASDEQASFDGSTLTFHLELDVGTEHEVIVDSEVTLGPAEEPLPADADGDGYEPADGDCDDGDADVHPGASELCNDRDDDCDGDIDEDCEA